MDHSSDRDEFAKSFLSQQYDQVHARHTQKPEDQFYVHQDSN